MPAVIGEPRFATLDELKHGNDLHRGIAALERLSAKLSGGALRENTVQSWLNGVLRRPQFDVDELVDHAIIALRMAYQRLTSDRNRFAAALKRLESATMFGEAIQHHIDEARRRGWVPRYIAGAPPRSRISTSAPVPAAAQYAEAAMILFSVVKSGLQNLPSNKMAPPGVLRLIDQAFSAASAVSKAIADASDLSSTVKESKRPLNEASVNMAQLSAKADASENVVDLLKMAHTLLRQAPFAGRTSMGQINAKLTTLLTQAKRLNLQPIKPGSWLNNVRRWKSDDDHDGRPGTEMLRTVKQIITRAASVARRSAEADSTAASGYLFSLAGSLAQLSLDVERAQEREVFGLNEKKVPSQAVGLLTRQIEQGYIAKARRAKTVSALAGIVDDLMKNFVPSTNQYIFGLKTVLPEIRRIKPPLVMTDKWALMYPVTGYNPGVRALNLVGSILFGIEDALEDRKAETPKDQTVERALASIRHSVKSAAKAIDELERQGAKWSPEDRLVGEARMAAAGLAFPDEEQARRASFKISSNMVNMMVKAGHFKGPTDALFTKVKNLVSAVPRDRLPAMWGITDDPHLDKTQDFIAMRPREAFKAWMRNVAKASPALAGRLRVAPDNASMLYLVAVTRVSGEDMAMVLFRRYFATKSDHPSAPR